MSHFSVIVIGPNPDKQLAPFNEELREEPYWKEISPSTLEWAERSLGVNELARANDLDYLELVARWLTENDGDKHEVLDGKICYESTYNKRAKWDYHSLGWGEPGYFPLKNGKSADIAKKKDIDFDTARLKARQEAELLWDKWHAITAKHGTPDSWVSVRGAQEDTPEGIRKARLIYHAQPAVKAVLGDNDFSISCPIAYFGTDKEEFLTQQANCKFIPFAFLKDDVWYERGTMRMFGIALDEMSVADWQKQINDIYESLPDNTLISIHDCHS